MCIRDSNLGDIYWQLGVAHWPAAEAAFSQALAIAQEFGNRSMQFYVASSLALLAGTMGEDAAAWSFHEQAITHSEALRTSLTSPSARADFASVIANTFAQAVLFCVASNRPREAFDPATCHLQLATRTLSLPSGDNFVEHTTSVRRRQAVALMPYLLHDFYSQTRRCYLVAQERCESAQVGTQDQVVG